MGLVEKVKILLKFKKMQNEFQKARRENTLNKSLRALGHALALSAPLVGAYLFEQLGGFLGRSDDKLLQAVGAVLGALVPLLRRFGSPDDRSGGA